MSKTVINNECKEETYYNDFENLLTLPQDIINYLFDNSTNFWKLLYYENKTPLSGKDLTNAQKAKMICKDPVIDNSTASKNVLFQIQVDDALDRAKIQVRLEIGNVIPTDSYTNGAEIIMQVSVEDKLRIISMPQGNVIDRTMAIVNELAKQLNGKMIGNVATLYMNRRGLAGGRTGLERTTFNNHFAGYYATFVALS